MKRCPTCQKTFDDDKRFCQIDGTPLVADEVKKDEPDDPFKTVVGQPFNPPANAPADSMKTMVADSRSKDEDILQIPEVFDPMKTMVVPDSVKKDIASSKTPEEPKNEQPEPPKFVESSLNPPSFGDLSSPSSGSELPKFNDSPKFDSPFSPPKEDLEKPKTEPHDFNAPFATNLNQPPKLDSPFSSPPNESPKFDSPFSQSPPPPYKEPDAMFGEKKDPFDNSPFGQPQTPFGQSNAPYSQPASQSAGQNDWTPPPAPVDSWQNQEVGANTPFSPPVAGAAGQNQTLAIVSLVLGIISIPCCGFVIFGIAAAVTGFLAKKKADENPNEYGGRGLALAGMIIGGITAVLGLILTVLQLLFGILGTIGR